MWESMKIIIHQAPKALIECENTLERVFLAKRLKVLWSSELHLLVKIKNIKALRDLEDASKSTLYQHLIGEEL